MNLLKKILLILIVICLTGSISAISLTTDETVIEVEGIGVIKDGNKLLARETAIKDALRNAVEQVVGMLIDAQTRVNNFTLLDDSILTKASGYVSKYEILDAKEDGEYLKVTMRATVKKEMVLNELDQLQLLVQRAGKPRVMVHITETSPNGEKSLFSENEIINQLMAAGFPLIDKSQAKKISESQDSPLSFADGADILVTGDGNGENIGKIYGLISYRVGLTVKVVRADTGEIILTHSVQASGADLSEGNAAKRAFQKAGILMGEYLKQAIPGQLTINQGSIQLLISNISYQDLQLLEQRLKEIHLVQNVFLRDYLAKTAQFDIDTSLSVTQLADELNRFREINFKITKISGNKIELERDETGINGQK